jgi:hypothetical protein
VRWFFIPTLLLMTYSFASSLQLFNDSPYTLDAVIINAIGDVVGAETLQPQELKYWNMDSSGILLQFNKAYVPYTVLWYCQEGKEYGIWTIASPGSRISPQLSDGPKICKMKNVQEKIDRFEGKPNPVLVTPQTGY